MKYSKDIETITKTIGEKLEAIKKEKKYTYKYIVGKTGISERTLRKIFKGYTKLTLDQLCVLSRFFKVTPSDLLKAGALKFNENLINIENNLGSLLAYSLYFLVARGLIGSIVVGYDNSTPPEKYYTILDNPINVYPYMNNLIEFMNNSNKYGINPEVDAYIMYQNEIFKKYVDEFNNGFEKNIQENKKS